MRNTKFKHRLLAASVATIVATIAGTVQAQEVPLDNDQELAIEEVQVTGIRASLKRSMDMKREAKGVVDGISAEDIGKFPDTNLAESLQRITGIAIDRARGEGSQITVRGFGPDFNLVTFNGRQMPSTGGRSFEFSNIASEGISAVEVYKSGRANVATGGIGAVVNVKTNKPLNAPGFQAAISGKGVHDPGTREGNSLTPEIAGLISNTFADDTFGVSLSASYQERDGGTQSATTQDFHSRNFISAADLELDPNHPDNEPGTILVGDPSALGFPSEVNDGIYAIPTNVQYNLDDFHRERSNAQLTLQWRPFESLTASVDYTYSQQVVDTVHQDLSASFNSGCTTRDSEWVQEGNIWSPTRYSMIGCSQDVLQGVGKFAFVNENKSVGVNVEWQPTDQLTLTLDYHDSSGEGRPNSKHGSSGVIAVASNNRITTDAYFSADGMPIFAIELGERNRDNQVIRRDVIDVNDMQITGSIFATAKNQTDIEQIQIDSAFEFDGGNSIDFGIGSTEVTNQGQTANIQRNSWSGVGEPGDIADLLTIDSIDGVFDNLEGSGDPRQATDFFTWDYDSLIVRAEELIASGDHAVFGNGGPCLTSFCPSYDFSLDEITVETSNSAYIQTHMMFEPFNMSANVFAGLRYEETKVHSEALSPLEDHIEWDMLSDRLATFQPLNPDGTTMTGFTEIDGQYDVLLPSVDLDIEVIEDVIIRASASKTITRPVYNDLKGALVIDAILEDNSIAHRGNPQLKPMESTNFDYSVEWYFDDASYVSVGFWTKDVDNFIVNGVFEDEVLFSNLTTPIGNENHDEAILALTGGDPLAQFTQEELINYYAENFADEPGVEVTGEGTEDEPWDITVTGTANDPVVLFDINVPINQNKTKVEGWELVAQHTLDSGFGFQANYTTMASDLNYDINLKEAQWVVPGMSDTANLIGFYDKSGLQIRLAYNWRDEFLANPGVDPTFVEEYFQWDANISYEINDNMSVFVEGINITEENRRVHGRSSYQVRNYDVGHARYTVGASYRF